ncbi:hypothetical protein Tco_0857462 [Tanacetum coccineum]|uniref:Uncharacterized protein n=1 Tax=Tanacetum coccineum TaxID=301880 RepID=A0ABQ5B6P6_9ASTR
MSCKVGSKIRSESYSLDENGIRFNAQHRDRANAKHSSIPGNSQGIRNLPGTTGGLEGCRVRVLCEQEGALGPLSLGYWLHLKTVPDPDSRSKEWSRKQKHGSSCLRADARTIPLFQQHQVRIACGG